MLLYLIVSIPRPRGYKTSVHSQTQNKAQSLAAFLRRFPYDLLPDDVTIFGSFYQLLTSYKTDAHQSLYN